MQSPKSPVNNDGMVSVVGTPSICARTAGINVPKRAREERNVVAAHVVDDEGKRAIVEMVN